MLVLLPPSETKRPGGRGGPLDLEALAFPQLREERTAVISALVEVSSDEAAAIRALKLSEGQRGEIAVNARIRSSPTMSAVDRYTGVLFDALDAEHLDRFARRWLGRHVLIQTAPFGIVGALDPIPSYRMSASAVLPRVPSLRTTWADAVTSALDAAAPAFVLDLRSEAYAALGPVPSTLPTAYVRIVDGDGRALNHFNKHTKGVLVRRLAQERPRIQTSAGFVRWARHAGWAARLAGPEVELAVARH